MVHDIEKSSESNAIILSALFAVVTLIITLSFAMPATQYTAFANAPNSDKETICHAPLGNTENQHTITVGASALNGHSKHDDHFGSCPP
jgi:hypothetical protein